MRKLIQIFLLVLVTVSSASAYDFIEGGIAYNILSNGTLSVTYKWGDKSAPRKKNPATFSIDIPSEAYLYKGTVKIPSSVKHKGKQYKVTEIGYKAFNDCQQLTTLVLPEGLRRIEFQSIVMTKIRSLNIPSTVTEIVPGAITECMFLKKLTVSPGNPKYVSKDNCIYNKDMTQLVMVMPTLKSYEFPSTVTSVADFALDSSRIKRLVIPETVEYIGGQAFPQSTHIGTIVCDRILKKLPGSDDYIPDYLPLPLWAIGKEEYHEVEVYEIGPKPTKVHSRIYPGSIYEKRATRPR